MVLATENILYAIFRALVHEFYYIYFCTVHCSQTYTSQISYIKPPIYSFIMQNVALAALRKEKGL